MPAFQKISPIFLAVAVLALTAFSCSWIFSATAPTPTSGVLPAQAATSTRMPAPSFTATASSTLNPALTLTPPATLTSRPQPKWVTEFAQPLYAAAARRKASFQDDFHDRSGGWLTDRCGQRMKYLDDELVLTDCRAYRAGMNYADFVVEFEARFLPGSNPNSSWQFIFRRHDTLFTHLAVHYDGSVSIVDLVKNEHQEYPSAAHPGLETNHLVVIAKGSRFAFYLNNEPFYYVESPDAPLQGDILLGNEDGSGSIDLEHPAITAFNNFWIWDIRDITVP